MFSNIDKMVSGLEVHTLPIIVGIAIPMSVVLLALLVSRYFPNKCHAFVVGPIPPYLGAGLSATLSSYLWAVNPKSGLISVSILLLVISIPFIPFLDKLVRTKGIENLNSDRLKIDIRSGALPALGALIVFLLNAHFYAIVLAYSPL
ncbi:hypothetical protein [Sulfitobacter sp. MF3-043]|uniref:hypothetical protein n=1 Tax=Sulfitobacter sediminivivens TaxID=3252902 RepID=UPI0036DD4A53